MTHIVVVGAGQAGQALVTKLRALGFDGQISLIGEEPVPPYQRPPLSKKYLLGEMELERLFLRPETFYAEHDIALKTGAKVQKIDPGTKTVHLDGEAIRYDQLVLTTGSVPRKLPSDIGGDLAGVYVIRTLADVDAMAAEFEPQRSVLIVGGGYIGLEAAAVAARRGLKVTVVEMADRILQRVAAPETSNFIRHAHRAEGVEIRERTGLFRLIGDGHVTGAELSDGSTIETDFVVAGVGISPATKLAEDAGLSIDNGIATDAYGRTSDPFIWAAGDCSSFPYKDQRIRLESVGNAIEQAEVVAANILGANQEYIAKPWFWSDQFDMKLQIAGLNSGYDHIATREGDEPQTISFWYYRGDDLLAVDAINDPRAYMVGKRLIEMGKSPAPSVVSDAETDLKSLLRG